MNRHALNKIAEQLKISPLIKSDLSNATEVIKKIQRALKKKDDGKFGPASIAAYLEWAKENGKTPVLIYDSVSLEEILDQLTKYWRAGTRADIDFTTIILIIYLESLTYNVRPKKKGPVEFNRCGSPFGMMKKGRPTATGLFQINRPTLTDILKWLLRNKTDLGILAECGWVAGKNFQESLDNLEKLLCNYKLNIFLGLTLMYMDTTNQRSKNKILGRWEAWTKWKKKIKKYGKKVQPWIADLMNPKTPESKKKELREKVMDALRELNKKKDK